MAETNIPFIPSDSLDRVPDHIGPRGVQLELGADVLTLLELELDLKTAGAYPGTLQEEAPFGPDGPMQTKTDLPERKGPSNPRSSGVVWTDDPDGGQGAWDRDEDPEGD